MSAGFNMGLFEGQKIREALVIFYAALHLAFA